MGYGGVVVVAIVVKPAKRIIRKLREWFLAGRCVDCGRIPGTENTETTYKGFRRHGQCPRCNDRYRARRTPLTKTARARYDAFLIRRGKLVTKEIAAELREDDGFRQAAEAAMKGD